MFSALYPKKPAPELTVFPLRSRIQVWLRFADSRFSDPPLNRVASEALPSSEALTGQFGGTDFKSVLQGDARAAGLRARVATALM
jgi:hypothetical protein